MGVNNVSFPPQIDALIAEAEAAHPSLSPGLLRATIWQESKGSPSALSGKGARGIAQVMPDTAVNPKAGLGVDIPPLRNSADPKESINFMANALDALAQKHGSENTALAVYNAGPGHAATPFDKLPPETKGYVRSINGLQQAVTDSGDSSFTGLLNQAVRQKSQGNFMTENISPSDNGGARLDKLMNLWQSQADEQAKKYQVPASAPTAAPTLPISPSSTPAAAPAPSSPLQTAGRIGLGAAGGLGGAALGTMVGGIPGAIVGAGLGSAAGDYLASKTFDPIAEPGASALGSGIAGAAGEGAGALVGKLLFPSAVKSGGKELLSVLGKDAVPVPAQYFAGKGVNVLHNIGMSSFFGADALDQATKAALNTARSGLVDWQSQIAAQTGVGADIINQVAAKAAQSGAQANIAPIKAAAQGLLGNTVENSPMQSVLKKIINLPANTLPFSVNADQAIANQVAANAAGPGVVAKTIGLKEIRTELMAIGRDATSPAEKAAAAKLGQIVDGAAESALTSVDPALAASWRTGSATYKEGIQGKEIGDMLSKATVSGGEPGEIGGKQLMNAMKEHRLNSLNTPLDAAQIANLNTYAKAISAAEGSGSKAFTLVSNGLQVNAVVRLAAAAGMGYGAATGNAPVTGTAALMLLGPAAIAKMMASPAVFKLMLAASKVPAESRLAGSLGSQLVMQMAKEGIISPDQVQQTPAAQK